MILLLNTCEQRLSEREFVKPIENLLSNNGFDFETKHYLKILKIPRHDKVIICGTALKDFEYLKEIDSFSWIKNYNGKILGICSGTQIISRTFGMKLKERISIGSKEVRINKSNPLIKGRFKAYFLISKQPILKKNFIYLDEDEAIIKHKNKEIYGCLFHPEVLNPEIITNFCRL